MQIFSHGSYLVQLDLEEVVDATLNLSHVVVGARQAARLLLCW